MPEESNEHPDMHKGSCLCGAVEYEVTGPIGDITLCHCTMCRKEHGAPFGAYAPVRWENFQVVHGENKLKRYRSSADITRTFCSECGSTLQFIRDERPGFGLAVATLDTDLHRVPNAQIFTKYKSSWWPLHDNPPAHEEWPPPRS